MVFDVVEWLATLSGQPRAEIIGIGEQHEADGTVAQYRSATSLVATVRVTGMQDAGGQARWQVVAELRNRFVRIELPGDIRFVWS